MKVCHISWLTNYFSVACSAVWQHFIHLSKLESSQILKLLHQLILCNILKSFVVISTIFTASLPGVDSISRSYFLCSSTQSMYSFVILLSWDCSSSVTSSGSTPSFLFFSFPMQKQESFYYQARAEAPTDTDAAAIGRSPVSWITLLI